jgi:O-antigen/teichoic acid export membrane protein
MPELAPASACIQNRMTSISRITSWLQRNRTSVRMAFVLRIVSMVLASLFGLLWYRLLLRAMGDPLYGLLQNFQALTRLGGLGDLGLSAALALKVGLMLGSGEEVELQRLLASARSLFLFLSAGLVLLFLGLSPWLSRGLNFVGTPGAGSMTLLFLYGGLYLMTSIFGGYFTSLNYAHGTVTWIILPPIIFLQVLAPFAQWRLALLGAPLWLQCVPNLVGSTLTLWLVWRMLKWSHPWLGNLIPLRIERAEWKTLGSTSWWVYLLTIGGAIYVTSDRLVIGAAMGNAVIPTYQANYKACDLCISLILIAAFVGFPKITQWVSSSKEGDWQRALAEVKRLSIFEVVLTCGAAFGYLAFNNLFVRLWLGNAHQAPLAWQFAFACNLAVTGGGNAGIQLATRTGDQGLKRAGLAAIGAGVLNLGLSIFSVKLESITGVAVATVIAQSVYSMYLARLSCRFLGISTARWIARCWVLPVVSTLIAVTLKHLFPDDSVAHLGLLSVSYVVLLLVVCRLAGVTRELLRAEMNQLRALFLRS